MSEIQKGSRRRWAGAAILVIAACHTLFGLLLTARLIPDPGFDALVGERNVLVELLTAWSWAPTDPILVSMFWFFFFGFAFLPLGLLVRALEKKEVEIPKGVGFSLGVLGVAGGLCLPASGFWLVLAPAWNIARSS